MKKFENLGRRLSVEEQKMIMGGDPPGGAGCSAELDFCGTHLGQEYVCCVQLPRLTCESNKCVTSPE